MFLSRTRSTSCAQFQKITRPLNFKTTVNIGTTTKLHLEKGILKNTPVSFTIVEKNELKSVVNVNFVYRGYKSMYSSALLPKMIVLNKLGALMVTFQEPKQEQGRKRYSTAGMFECLITEVVVEVPANFKWDEIIFDDEEEEEDNVEHRKPTSVVPFDGFTLSGFHVSKLKLKGSGKLSLTNIYSEDISISGNYTEVSLKTINSLTSLKIDVKTTGGNVILDGVSNAESILIDSYGPVLAKSINLRSTLDQLRIKSKSSVSTLLKRGSLNVDSERNVEVYLPRTFSTSFSLKSQKRTFKINGVVYSRQNTHGTINCRVGCPSSLVIETKRDILISDESYLK